MRNLPNTVAPDSIEKAIADSTDAIKKLEEENAAFRQKNKESVAAKKLQKLQELNQQKEQVVKDFRTSENGWRESVRIAQLSVAQAKSKARDVEDSLAFMRNQKLAQESSDIETTCEYCGNDLKPENVEALRTRKSEALKETIDGIALREKAKIQVDAELLAAQEALENVDKEKPELDQPAIDKIDASITKLQQEIAGFDVNANMPDYAGRKAELEEELGRNQQIARILVLNEECEAKIVELEQQNAKDAALKSTLQQKIDSVGEFIKMKCEVAQEAVQKHFEGTGLSFDLFRFIKSTGEVKECCNILLNGTPYNDLSYSTKYIASLYIVEAFQRAYGVSLPIISDNTESIDYEGYAQSANAESQTILMFRVEENCPKCGGHSGRRSLNGRWTCQKCGNMWRKSVLISDYAE
jgi:hypothetical protein